MRPMTDCNSDINHQIPAWHEFDQSVACTHPGSMIHWRTDKYLPKAQNNNESVTPITCLDFQCVLLKFEQKLIRKKTIFSYSSATWWPCRVQWAWPWRPGWLGACPVLPSDRVEIWNVFCSQCMTWTLYRIRSEEG